MGLGFKQECETIVKMPKRVCTNRPSTGSVAIFYDLIKK